MRLMNKYFRYRDRFKPGLKQLSHAGFFHIFASSTINKMIGFISGVLLVRIVQKAEFGVYSYALTIFNVFVLVSGLGITSGLLQIGSERTHGGNSNDGLFRFGLKYGLRTNIVLIVIALIIAVFVRFPIDGSNRLLAYLIFLLIPLIVIEITKIRLRVDRKNKIFSILNTSESVLMIIFSVLGAMLFKTVGIIIGRWVALIMTVIIVLRINSANYNQHAISEPIDIETRKSVIRISYVSAINNGLSQLLNFLETFILGLITGSEHAIASYKVATIVPEALLFIPASLMTFAYPYFASNKNDLNWTKKNYRLLTLGSVALNLAISVLLISIAPLIMSILFGNQYRDSVLPFRILIVSFFFQATFRMIAGNLLVTQRKLRFNMVISVATTSLSLILNFILIPMYGAVGAALAHLGCIIITGIFNTTYYNLLIRGHGSNNGIFRSE